MRKLTANLILNPDGHLLADQAVVFDDSGKLKEIVPVNVAGEVESFNGILTPGFINVHCHLELSGFLGMIPPGEKLTGFIRDFISARMAAGESDALLNAIDVADAEMWSNGIQGVGDICNRGDTLNCKLQSPIRYHNFVEIFGLDENRIAEYLDSGNNLLSAFSEAGHTASIVPHAPYSVSQELFRNIHLSNVNGPWSIHNQESDAETELFVRGEGPFVTLFERIGLDCSKLPLRQGNSLQYTMQYFPEKANLLLVHDTFTTREDIVSLDRLGSLPRTWFAMCPKANLYIEGRLPDISMLREMDCRMTIGTDSLASNDKLDILDEMKTINKAFPEIPGSELLQWATGNGADFFGWNDLGRFAKNTSPGCVLIHAGNAIEDPSGWTGVTRLI